MVRSLDRSILLVLVAGCGPSIDLPVPPATLMATAAEYDHPGGTVPIDRATEVVSAAGAKLDALQESRVADLLADGLAALRQRLGDAGLQTDPAAVPQSDRPRIDAYVHAHRICRGWDPARTTPDMANGTLDVTAVLRGG